MSLCVNEMSHHKSTYKRLRMQRIAGRGGRTPLYLYIKEDCQRQFETSLEVLRQIALSGKAYQYKLKSKIGSGISYRTLLRHLELLKDLDAIEIDHLEPSSKKGKEKNVWRITFIGLLFLLKNILKEIKLQIFTEDIIWAIRLSPEQIEKMKKGSRWRAYKKKEKELDQLHEKYPEFLPLIFGKWDFFQKKEIKKRVIDHFSYIPPQYFEQQIDQIFYAKDCEETGGTYQLEKSSVQLENETKCVICNVIFSIYNPLFDSNCPLFDNIDSDAEEKYLLRLCEDEEIHKYIVQAIKKRQNELKKQHKSQLEALDSLAKLCGF